jgi:Flp pilus assembly protein TadG
MRQQRAVLGRVTVARIARSITAFWGDTDGVILPYVTMMLVVIVGVSVLALDGSRYMSMQTQLQNGADALALAGAAELDRTPTAIERATNAVDSLITNSSLFGSGAGRNVQVAQIRFLSSLPARDSDPILPANQTSDPTLAAFIEVTAEPIRLPTILPTSFFGGANVLAVGAQAVAGFDQVVCDFTPMFVCNPFETQGMTYEQATQALVSASNDPASQRQLIRLAGTQGKIGPFNQGDFGYLTPTTGSLPVDACGPVAGAGIGQATAASRPPTCLRLSAVDLQPGNNQAAMDGLNTRFDIYANGFQSCKANYVADVNVRKGFTTLGNANWCNAAPSGTNWPMANADAAPFPVDQNMIAVAATGQILDRTVAVGNGTWDCTGYWSVAHFAGPGKTLPPPGCTNTATISRYSVYQYEMNYISDRSPGTEIGAPQCNPLGIKYRRVLNAAIINCSSNPVTMRSDARNVPVAAFGKFFLALPAAFGANPYVEFMGLIKPTDGVNHDMVQLYR